VLQNFLCANANMPPPRLEISWATQYCPSMDEMEVGATTAAVALFYHQ
jgi:hypothetical protein